LYYKGHVKHNFLNIISILDSLTYFLRGQVRISYKEMLTDSLGDTIKHNKKEII